MTWDSESCEFQCVQRLGDGKCECDGRQRTTFPSRLVTPCLHNRNRTTPNCTIALFDTTSRGRFAKGWRPKNVYTQFGYSTEKQVIWYTSSRRFVCLTPPSLTIKVLQDASRPPSLQSNLLGSSIHPRRYYFMAYAS